MVDQKRLDNYQERMTTWIGRQGLIFQIRYLGLIKGGSIGARIASMVSIFGLTALLLGLFFLGGLKFYQKSETYQEKLEGTLGEVLGVDELTAMGFRQEGGNLAFRTLSLTGGPTSFFFEAKLTDLEAPFPFFAGAWDEWSPETVVIQSADLSLKAGGGEEEMQEAFARIFRSFDGSSVTRIKIQDLSLEWGYSKLTLGGVYHTKFDATLSEGKWAINLVGGKFRQNWLGPLQIEAGNLVVDETGVRVNDLKLVDGPGVLELSGEIAGSPGEPDFNLSGRFSRIPVQSLLHVEGVTESRFIEGTISGDLTITGSTNRKIRTSGKVVLGEGDEVLIRDRWRLLRSISAVVKDGTYLRIAFQSGSFDFSTGNGSCEIKNLNVVTDGVARLKGEFSTRLPSQEEAAKFLEISLTDGFSESLTDTSAAKILEDDRISIARAAKSADEPFKIELFEDQDLQSEVPGRIQEWDGIRLRREMRKHRFTGELQLALPQTVLSENERAAPFYPADERGWSWIPIQLNDVTFDEIGRKAGEKLMMEGREYQAADDFPTEDE